MIEKADFDKADIAGLGRPRKPGLLQLEPEEGAALVSACLVILFDLLKTGQTFPSQARPLFRVYCKLCSVSNHQADLTLLAAGMATWGGEESK